MTGHAETAILLNGQVLYGACSVVSLSENYPRMH